MTGASGAYSADYSGFAEGEPVGYVGEDSPPCEGCQRVRQQITDSRGNVLSLALGRDPHTDLWWCNGCWASRKRAIGDSGASS